MNSKMLVLCQIIVTGLVGETVNSHAFHACLHGFESRTSHHGGLAQPGEHLPYKQRVGGSIPSTSTTMPK